MKTRITELFGIQHPIIQGGMHYVGLAEMALQSLMQADGNYHRVDARHSQPLSRGDPAPQNHDC